LNLNHREGGDDINLDQFYILNRNYSKYKKYFFLKYIAIDSM
jgi:hypothetical protein